ncbi:dihydrofolate reductase family protein [Agilicoccus flavus]|uniref:dihydrofolate reductase family protein n=1 Tax=Agilicoccus flavus TaxID=2775968 RepID=UPI001CF67D9A|nr:dihydrofolate reductase family protein [Agilicoccus flavus]
MGRLIYGGIGSLDGFIADVDGDFSWSAPDEQVHAYLNDRDREVAAELYGRRLYEVMKVWETYGTEPDASSVVRDYGRLWRDRDKVVYSTTLADVDTARTRLERTFDPVQARRLVDEAGGDVTIGGPDLAAHALRAGIVDVVEYYANPVVLGAGTPWLPAGLRLDLRLVDEHRFDCGVVHLAYEVVNRPRLSGRPSTSAGMGQ